uniref:Uncharacterized protein n=1 Tax=Fagus sylvatica TaxID=28930 RepID=A0A2N9GB67_FAGSY
MRWAFNSPEFVMSSTRTTLPPEPPSLPFPCARPPPPPKACLAPPPKPSTDVVDLEDAEVTSVPTVEEPVDADLPPDVSTPADEGGSTAPLDADLDDL